jgi:hypothetical protein
MRARKTVGSLVLYLCSAVLGQFRFPDTFYLDTRSAERNADSDVYLESCGDSAPVVRVMPCERNSNLISNLLWGSTI